MLQYQWDGERYNEGFELFRQWGNQEPLTFTNNGAFLESLIKRYPQRFRGEYFLLADMGSGRGNDGAFLATTIERTSGQKVKYISIDLDPKYNTETLRALADAGIENAQAMQGDVFDPAVVEAMRQNLAGGTVPDAYNYAHVVYFANDKLEFARNLNDTMAIDGFTLLAHGASTSDKLLTAFESLNMPHYTLADMLVEIPFDKILGEPMTKKHWQLLQQAESLQNKNHDPYPDHPGLTTVRKIIEFRARGPLEAMSDSTREQVLNEFRQNVENPTQGEVGSYTYNNKIIVALPRKYDYEFSVYVLHAVNEVRQKNRLEPLPEFIPNRQSLNGIAISRNKTIYVASENPHKLASIREFFRPYGIEVKGPQDTYDITGYFGFPPEKSVAEGGTCERNSEGKAKAYAERLREGLARKWHESGWDKDRISEELKNHIVIGTDDQLVVDGLQWLRTNPPTPTRIEGRASTGREFPGVDTKPWVQSVTGGISEEHHMRAYGKIMELLGASPGEPISTRLESYLSFIQLNNLDGGTGFRTKSYKGETPGTLKPPSQGEYGWGFERVFYPDSHQGYSLADLTLEEKNRINPRGAALGLAIEKLFVDTEPAIYEFDLRGLSSSGKEREIAHIKRYIARYKTELGFENAPVPFICGSAMVEDSRILNAAHQMAKRYGIVITGGGAKSVMGALADGAALPIGITCDIVENIEPVFGEKMKAANRPYIIIRTDNIRERLALMRELSEIEICKQGGVGTIEEMFTGVIAGRKILLEHPFYLGMQQFADKLFEYAYIDAEQRARFAYIDKEGKPVGHYVPSRHGDAELFRQRISEIIDNVAEALRGRGFTNIVRMPTGKSVDALDNNASLYLAGPGDFHTITEVFELMVKKRMENGMEAKTGQPNPLKNKPLIVVNVDGFYDGVKETLATMEKEGYMRKGEKVSDLVTFLDIRTTDKVEDINRTLKDAMGINMHAIAAQWVHEGIQNAPGEESNLRELLERMQPNPGQRIS